jgi:hypothetical protein
MSLYQELAGRIGLGESKIVPRLFEMLADETDAGILLSLPGTVPEVQAKMGLSQEEAEKRMKELFLKGLVFPSHKTTPTTYRMGRDFVQFHDATILWKDAPIEFLDLWQEFMEKGWNMPVVSEMLPKPFTRMIPVNVSIQAKTNILDFESVSEMVKKARILAVTKCTCRLTARKCDRPLEACIQVNNAAAYALSRGTGRKITVEEALDISKVRRRGPHHVTMNR